MIDTRAELAKVTTIHVWYDRYDTKVWYVTAFGSDGDLVGESYNSHRKSSAQSHATGLALEAYTVSGDTPIIKVFTRDGYLQSSTDPRKNHK